MKKLTVAQFNKLPKAKKAVLVAKDVIAQIKAKRYEAKTGTYIRNLRIMDENQFGGYLNGDISKQFEKIESCEICALGGMLMSCTHLGNKLTTNDIDVNDSILIEELNNEKVKKLFASIFDNLTLLKIETAFEGYEDWGSLRKGQILKIKDFTYKDSASRYGKNIGNKNLEFEETVACELFKRKYRSDTTRLIKICENIIKNKGIFKP